jgi:Ca2+-transporting ATPase
MDTRNIQDSQTPQKNLDPDDQQTRLFVKSIFPIKNYVSDEKKLPETAVQLRPFTAKTIRARDADRFAYLKTLLEKYTQHLIETLYLTFSIDKIKFDKLVNSIFPLSLAFLSYSVSEYFTKQISANLTGCEDYNFIIKLISSSAVIYVAAKHDLSRSHTDSHFTLKAAAELLAIGNFYSASFAGSQKFLAPWMNNAYAFLLSCVNSGIILPTAISAVVQRMQQNEFKNDYIDGSQRMESALVTRGMTPAANIFFQVYSILRQEFTFSRKFQIGLIADNIIDGTHISERLRNLPSLGIDLVPQVLRKLFIEQRKLIEDYQKNNRSLSVLDKLNLTASFKEVKLHELKKGDLVWCGKNIDVRSVPVSGELHAFERDSKGDFMLTRPLNSEAYVNLKTYTGENFWIKQFPKPLDLNCYADIDQKRIQKREQAGILVGAELDLLGKENDFFIRVGKKNETLTTQPYEKKSVINDVINYYKKEKIIIAVSASLLCGLFIKQPESNYLQVSSKLLFSLFQMIIPFSESFLREAVNSYLLKNINFHLPENPMEMLDVLRLTDFWHANSGYYAKRFPKGTIIISDKTGTLTTTEMKTLGVWTEEMPEEVKLTKSEYLPKKYYNLIEAFEVFCAAYTFSKKELEPEEHSILNFFKQTFGDSQCLEVKALDSNHFQKSLRSTAGTKKLETYHLGLFHFLGGRITLVKDKTHYFIVFCGIPNVATWQSHPLNAMYTKMQARVGVLSRDWCVGKAYISEALFKKLLNYHETENITGIADEFNNILLSTFRHYGTFLVDNPVKKGVQNFIRTCHNVDVPVIVATGDTPKAALNIIKVLCPEQKPLVNSYIFTGFDHATQEQLIEILQTKKNPMIVCASMTTSDKGRLAIFLKNHGYFIVANGDGTNDTAMMRVADFVMAHCSPNGDFAPGVAQFVNLSDTQLQTLNKSPHSFYDLFDIDQAENSQFILPFIKMANAQEMVSIALNFKSIKMFLEFAKAFGISTVTNGWQQLSIIAYDLIWLAISFYSILDNAELPSNNQNLEQSFFATKCMYATVALAAVQAFISYELDDKTTDITLMVIQLAILPMFLKSFFRGYAAVQQELPALTRAEKAKLESKPPASFLSKLNFFENRKNPVENKNLSSNLTANFGKKS